MSPYYFGVRDAKIAGWNSTGSYDAAIDLIGIRRVEVRLRTTSGELNGDDVELDAHSQIIGCEITIEFAEGAQTMEAIAAMFNVNLSSDADETELAIGDENAAYIGFHAQVYETNGVGDMHIFVAKAKNMGDLSYNAQYGGYVIKQMTLRGFLDGAQKILRVKRYATATPIAFPLAAVS